METKKIVQKVEFIVLIFTIQNCFQHVNFIKKGNEQPISTGKIAIDLPVSGEMFENYVNFDNDLNCYGDMDNEKIIEIAVH